VSLPPSIEWYEQNAPDLVPRYESICVEEVHDWFLNLLPAAPAVILDVGAGSGRDAHWLAQQGHEVVAVEPAIAMRQAAEKLHPDPRIRWITGHLPGLDHLSRSGLSFDAILLSAVWMHVLPNDRPRAFRKLLSLLKPGGILAVSLRQGLAEPERAIHPAPLDEIERLARDHGAQIERVVNTDDRLGRQEVSWIQVVIRLPDDGTGALPLLRHLILNDAKSATYKLGLLRTLCRAADGAGGFAEPIDDDSVSLPLGLLALIWIRLYRPLLEADLPQTPTNRGCDGLSFAGAGFQQLGGISQLDLRVGSRFGGATGGIVHQALHEACQTICTMPARYLTYPNGEAILKIARLRRRSVPESFIVDRPYLASFGEVRAPRNLWQATQRFAAWIEPALMAEWIRLMKGYSGSQGRSISEGVVGPAMTWSDPDRDVAFVSKLVSDRLEQGETIRCVWTDRKLSRGSLDIDHCFPCSAWPCSDLWNLLPASSAINRHQKRDRLPSADRLVQAEDRIKAWWMESYLRTENSVIQDRFVNEARASLPHHGNFQDASFLDAIFSAVSVQRLRLKQDQQIPEWL